MNRTRVALALAGAVTLGLAGCQGGVNQGPVTADTSLTRFPGTSLVETTLPPLTATGTPASCHSRLESGQPLPDPACTPGETNPAVTPVTVGTTICHAGWTATVRPPVAYTNHLKRVGIQAYGYVDQSLVDYEEDHLVPLELGGSPTDPRNLWPEPGRVPNAKDAVETALNHAVCANRVNLTLAQRAIASDWVTAEARLGIE